MTIKNHKVIKKNFITKYSLSLISAFRPFRGPKLLDEEKDRKEAVYEIL